MKYEDVVGTLQKVFPFDIRYKDSSAWWRRIGNTFPSLLKNATFLNGTVWLPSRQWEGSSSIVYLAVLLSRGVVVMNDRLTFFPLYWFLMLLPPIRLLFERRAYRASLITFNLFLISWNILRNERLERIAKTAESYNLSSWWRVYTALFDTNTANDIVDEKHLSHSGIYRNVTDELSLLF